MGRLIVLVLAAALGWYAYGKYFRDSEPVHAYKQFAKAWANGRPDQARDLTAGPSVDRTIVEQSLYNLMGGIPVQNVHGVDFSIESEFPRGSSVVITAVQTVAYDPPGTASALGGVAKADVRQTVEMTETADGWKVISFQPVLLDDGLGSR
jgi:hypothetical protein